MDQTSYADTPVSFGRGRGVLGSPIPFPTVSPFVRVDVRQREVPTLDSVSSVEPPTTDSHVPQLASTSTPKPLIGDSDLVGQMSVIVQQIGQQLADSIMSHLNTSSLVPGTTSQNVRVNQSQQSEPSDSQVLDLSHVKIVNQRKVKEPPIFRGESSDTVTLDEWEDIMRNYIKKGNVRTEEQAEEMLINLRGRAKDVVKFGIRNSNIDIHKNPDAIYGLLRKHFSCSQYSSIPLADFYTTMPKDKEDPFEYWLRLNRAADIAVECLKEQGKTLDNPSMEVTRMFIRNCPSKDLALTFRSKTVDKWTAHEVMDVLNEYHSEESFRASTALHREASEKVVVNKIQVSPCSAPSPDRQEAPQVKSSDHALEKVIDMLEKVLLRGSGRAQSNPRRQTANMLPRIEGLNDTPCRVCADASHSTLSHCRENKLCFQCHSPDHTRLKCPEIRTRTAPGQQGN